MENQEIKEANRKAMPMFILLVIAGAAAGGIMGFVIAKYGLHGFSENIERVADVFSCFLIGAVYSKGLEIFKSR